MKRSLLICSLLLVGGLFSSTVFAGECGAGKITHIEEGFNNTDDLLIAIDYTVGTHPGGYLVQDRYIRFKAANLSPDRFRGIKAIIYMAYSKGSYVFVKAIGGACGNANNIRILEPGTPLEPPVPPPL